MASAAQGSQPPAVVSVSVFSDYVCPYCMLAEPPLQAAVASARKQRNLDVQVVWKPFELHPRPNETLRPEDDYLQEAWKHGVYPAAQRMGVPIKLPSTSPQPYSDLAFEGFQYAQEHGKANEYNHEVFAAFFQRDEDIGQQEVLTRIAASVGLNADDFAAALASRRYRDAHQRALQEADAQNIRSVPTYVIQGRRTEQISGVLMPQLLEKAIASVA